MESTTAGKEPKDLEAVEEETDVFKADGEDSKDSKSDEEARTLIASPRENADAPQRSTVAETACPGKCPISNECSPSIQFQLIFPSCSLKGITKGCGVFFC